MSVAIGSRLGPYEIIGTLGAGGMGEVYRARDPRIGRDVAVKVLPASLANDADRLRRFEQEARATGTLNHPNLLVIFDFGSHELSPFIVSELLEGQTLRDVLRNKVPVRKALDFAVQIANGLAAAHDKGIVHRDLKPENIFITHDDRVKLLDFGLAKLTIAAPDSKSRAQTEERATSPGVIVGTAGYMSPEQVRGAAIDHRSDIFALGIVLYEMVSGTQPFRRDSAIETMNAILHDEAPALKDDVPPVLARLLQHAMEKNPSRRFESAKDIAFALDAISGSGETSAVRSKSKPRKTKSEQPKEPSYTRITFRRGYVMSARFAPDGSIFYGAAWEEKPLEVFTSRDDHAESRALGLESADVLAVSSTGEMALSLGRRYVAGYVTLGTLARLPRGGGVPRVVSEGVQDAEWMPGGKELIITRNAGGVFHIEAPIGNVILQTPHWISHARPSPNGDFIAYVDHPVWGDDGGSLVVVDRGGKEVFRSADDWNSTQGIAWTPKGDEVWIAAQGHATSGRQVLAFSMSGRQRNVLSGPGRCVLYDIAQDGRALVGFGNTRRETVAGQISGGPERNLSWFDWSWLSDLSRDGKFVSITEQAEAVRMVNTTFVRPSDGSAAMQIGEGHARGKAISPDGQWILVATPGGVQMLPIGAGRQRTINLQTIDNYLAGQFFPDQKRILVLGNEKNEPTRLYEVWIDGSQPVRRISDIVAAWPALLSNDGTLVATPGTDGQPIIVPVHGGDPRPVKACDAEDMLINWTADDKGLWVHKRGRISVTIERVSIDDNTRKAWHTIEPSDAAGIVDIFPVHITPDGQSYAYSFRRTLSDLYVVSGLI